MEIGGEKQMRGGALPVLRRIALFRALQLGDMLCAVPALRALRCAYPQARVYLVGLPWARSFVERFRRYVDEFVEFPGFPGLPERIPDVRRLPSFLKAMQVLRFDLAIQMHGSGEISNPLVALFRARFTAGFYVPGQFCPENERFLPVPRQLPEVERHLRLMERLGAPSQGAELEFPLWPEDQEELRSLPEAHRLESGDYACLHPGARHPQRRWPVERFAALADALAARGLQIVLTGSADESELVSTVARRASAPTIDLSGKTSLGSFAALLKGARLLICNDTGASHLAAALQVPSVVLFTSSSARRWSPRDARLHRPVLQARSAPPERALEEVDRLPIEANAYAPG